MPTTFPPAKQVGRLLSQQEERLAVLLLLDRIFAQEAGELRCYKQLLTDAETAQTRINALLPEQAP